MTSTKVGRPDDQKILRNVRESIGSRWKRFRVEMNVSFDPRERAEVAGARRKEMGRKSKRKGRAKEGH